MNQITTSTPAQSLTPDHALAAHVAEALRDLRMEGGPAALPVPLPKSFRDQLAQRQVVLRTGMMPARGTIDRQKIARSVGLVLGLYANDKRDPQTTIAAYITQLEALPVWAVEQACDDIAKGRVTDLSPDFPPSAPRIFQIAEAKITPFKEEASNISRLLLARVEQHTPQPTPEERARVGASVQAFLEERKKVEAPERELLAARKAQFQLESKDRHLKELLAEYRMQGFEPVYTGNGVLMSLGMARATGAKLVRTKDKIKQEIAEEKAAGE